MTDIERIRRRDKRMKIKQKFNEFMKYYPFNSESFADEIWRDIIGYEGHYKVSNYGRVKGSYRGLNKILRPTVNPDGYIYFRLSLNNELNGKLAHVLVAKAFIDNPQNKPQVNHCDGMKWNNHVSNLEWVTPSENQHHAYKIGLRKEPQGENRYNAKLTSDEVYFCRKNYKPRDKNFGVNALARKFKITPTAMSKIIRGKKYKNVPMPDNL